MPAASFRSCLATETLAVRLGVPVISASRGLPPPSHPTATTAAEIASIQRNTPCLAHNKKSTYAKFRRCLILWCRGTESNCRHGDFQTKFLKMQKYRNYKQLILFQFFIVFLVSFGTVWKYLTLTGTIWAQSHSPEILLLIQFQQNIVSFRVSACRFAQSQQRYPALSNKGRSTASAGPAIQEPRDASGRVP